MSEHGVAPARGMAVRMRPEQLLATRDALQELAHGFTDAYLAEHPAADEWAVFFAALEGLQTGVNGALERLTAPIDTRITRLS
jgi:hypothetical protein